MEITLMEQHCFCVLADLSHLLRNLVTYGANFNCMLSDIFPQISLIASEIEEEKRILKCPEMHYNLNPD